MSLKSTSELIGVLSSNLIVLKANRFVNLTMFNVLNLKIRDLREEKSSIMISDVWYIP